MPLQSPGSKRLTKADLRDYLETCQFCGNRKWIYVAIKSDNEWQTFKFPCRCVFPQGYVPDQLMDLKMYRNRQPDSIGEPEPHVLIHPAYSRDMWGNLKQDISSWKQRMAAQVEAEEQGLPF